MNGTDHLEDIGDVEFGTPIHKRRSLARDFKTWCEEYGGDVTFDRGGMPKRMQCDVGIVGDIGTVTVDYGRSEERGPQVTVQDMEIAGEEVRAGGYAEDVFINGRRFSAELEGDGYIRLNP